MKESRGWQVVKFAGIRTDEAIVTDSRVLLRAGWRLGTEDTNEEDRPAASAK